MSQYVAEHQLSSKGAPAGGSSENLPTFFGDKSRALRGELDKAQGRIRVTLEAINSAMALRNSEKGIAEAENVKRLTELAFFFIPLTFAAAIFSIQVQEFEQSPPQMTTFVITAVCLLFAVYCFRLAQYLGNKYYWGTKLGREINRTLIKISDYLENQCENDDCCGDECCGVELDTRSIRSRPRDPFDPAVDMEGVVCQQPRPREAPSIGPAVVRASTTSQNSGRVRGSISGAGSGSRSNTFDAV